MARLTKEQIQDRSRYQFATDEVEIPELGGSVEVKTLSVKRRDDLPALVEPMLDKNGAPVLDKDGDPVMRSVGTLDDLAVVFATVVSDPQFSVEEAKDFLGDLPSAALDRVIEKFGELLSGPDDSEGKDGSSSAEN